MTARIRFGERRVTARVPAPKTDGKVGTLRISGPIDSWGGEWGLSAAEFAQALDELGDVDELRLHVNSPGGEVYDGIAILNALRSHPARTTAIVEGIAASAASFIVAGCDEVVMSPNTELMIHDARGIAIGDPSTMQSMADDLNRISDNLASIYAERAGGDVADWRARMQATTWYTAEQAVEAGLADSVDTARKADEKGKAKALADLATFAARHDAAPILPAASAVGSASPAPTPSGDTEQEGSDMGFTPEQMTALCRSVGVPEDADAGTVLNALDEALQERAEVTARVAVPEGMAVVDAATLDQLRADAALGRRAAEENAQARREQLVNAAVQDGRIPPARREQWLNALKVDEGMADALASLAPGLIPVAEVGAAPAVDSLDVERDALYASLFPTVKGA